MSRIGDLIQELTPRGVEYKTLGQTGEFLRGNGLQKKDLLEVGVPAVHYGQIHTYYGAWTRKTKSFADPIVAAKLRHVRPGDLMIATTSEDDEAVAKATAWLGEEDAVIGGDAYIYRHSLDPKYASYLFQTDQFQSQKRRFVTGTKVRRVSGASLETIRIPVPPLEVQREIVRILDTFTELEAEQEAELEARRQQYRHYLNLLINRGIARSRPWVSLKDLFDVRDGTHESPTRSNSGFPLVTSKNISGGYVNLSSAYMIDESDFIEVNRRSRVDRWNILISMIGTVGEVAIVDKVPQFAIKNVGLIRCKDERSSRFLAYYLRSEMAKKYISNNLSGTAQKYLSLGKLRNLPVPVISDDDQGAIVQTLSKFDALVNDLSLGLPAELNARRKQYEYYRDKLLTFKEAPA